MSNPAFFIGPLPVDAFETSKIFEVKSETLFTGKLMVEKHLPIELAEGMFTRPGTHDIAVRVEPGSSAMTLCVAGSVLNLAAAGTPNHPMDAVYTSQAPFTLGEHLVDVCMVPSSAGLLALKQHPFSPENPIALREATLAFFQYNPAEFDLKVRVAANDSTQGCLEYRTVARVIIPAKIPCEPAAKSVASTPAHTLAA